MSELFKFHVLARGKRPPMSSTGGAYLVEDNWDDFSYRTTFDLIVFDQAGDRHDLGSVKIGHPKMEPNRMRPEIPTTFIKLDKAYFSLGQSEDYYATLAKLNAVTKRAVLGGLRDVVASPTRWGRAVKYDVTKTSLLRSVSSKSVTGQYKRLLEGGVRLTKYSFSYDSPAPTTTSWPVPQLTFRVVPDSTPPTNVHALIGRNGVGKSRLLRNMALSLTSPQSSKHGRFGSQADDDRAIFASVVSVTFSAFDDFTPIDTLKERGKAIKYFYIGLGTRAGSKAGPPKAPPDLAHEFASSIAVCASPQKAKLLRQTFTVLQSDPLFSEAEIISLIQGNESGSLEPKSASEVFSGLSAGHKIVLLTITRLVEVLEEKTLVLMDEPEAHLHPPLLSAFVRAMSDLLVCRNAVAIVATHSPVVLQEVPKSCAWVLRRNGQEVAAERPSTETFGENIGVLTREVFGLEASQSGFHQLLERAVDQSDSYDEAVDAFDEALGAEARAVLRAMMVMKERTQE